MVFMRCAALVLRFRRVIEVKQDEEEKESRSFANIYDGFLLVPLLSLLQLNNNIFLIIAPLIYIYLHSYICISFKFFRWYF